MPKLRVRKQTRGITRETKMITSGVPDINTFLRGNLKLATALDEP